MKRHGFIMLTIISLGFISPLFADSVTVPIYLTEQTNVGKIIGNIQITETDYGLLFSPNLLELPPGIHGFHIHENAACGNGGMDAGGHYDPQDTGKHLGPYNDRGHLGDLPVLVATEDGRIIVPVLAPRISHISEIKNRSLIIHLSGDSYSDAVDKSGGGGMRMACGVIP